MRTEPHELERVAPIPPGEIRPRAARSLAGLAGPALIVGSVLLALRGFAFADLLTNQHPDILSFWLPRSCLMGWALRAGHVPLWNPYEMAGTPFAADAQSGWLSLPAMALPWAFGCGGGLRAMIVLNPILAGLGTWWFLRREGLGRPAATAGGLSLAMAMAASQIAISMPFAGTLAWAPYLLVGASGYLSARGLGARLPWLALAALAWGQVAAAHLSHGLVMATALALAYVGSRLVADVRAGTRSWRSALALGACFVAFLPLANLAILVPRFALISRSSLRAGYGALEGTLARIAGVQDRPIPTTGVWSGWPFALASTPGAYVGAAMLLLSPMAFRERARRPLALAVASVALGGYLATLTLLVAWAPLRELVLRLPFGDVYLHNPGRLRYLAFLTVPLLGALGLQSLLERPGRDVWRWIGAAAIGWLGLPLALGARPVRYVVVALGAIGFVWAVRRTLRRPRGAGALIVGLLAVELAGGALWSSAYGGGTVFLGLEGERHPALLHGPLRWPTVDLKRYLTPGPIAREIARLDRGRYLAWIPPAAYFNKGYLFTQRPEHWPALLLGRAIVLRLHDVLGYSPIQLPRYWSYIRATNRLPVFYNAAVIQEPDPQDAWLLGVRFLIAPDGVPPPLPGHPLVTERGYTLYELDRWEPRVSVVASWREVDGGAPALRHVLEPDFDPAAEAIVEGHAGLAPAPGAPGSGVAWYREIWPEDVRITVQAPSDAIVVIRNAWDIGWQATVDGHPAPVLRADYLLQGVPVPAGRHEIRLTYREPTIGLGLALSAAVWIAYGALGAATWWRRWRSRVAGAPPR
jgi:hypothetical protein